MVGENYNHFGLAEILGNPYRLLGRSEHKRQGLGDYPIELESPMRQDV